MALITVITETEDMPRIAPPWCSIESVTTITEPMKTAKMLRTAHLANWNIHLMELKDLVTDGYKFVSAPQVVVRAKRGRGPAVIMGVVGQRYQIVQNEDTFAFGDALLRAGSGTWEAAGAIKDDRIVFGAVDLHREILIGEAGDRVAMHLIVSSSHDGTAALSVATMAVRVSSQSVMNITLPGAEQSSRMRHTPSVSEANHAAKEAIEVASRYTSRFKTIADALASKKLTDRQFGNLVELVYPKPDRDVKGAMSRWATKRKVIQDIWEGSAGTADTTKEIRGTAWGALCTLLERIDYFRAPRMDNAENLLVAASGFDAMSNMEKNRITGIVLKYAKVT